MGFGEEKRRWRRGWRGSSTLATAAAVAARRRLAGDFSRRGWKQTSVELQLDKNKEGGANEMYCFLSTTRIEMSLTFDAGEGSTRTATCSSLLLLKVAFSTSVTRHDPPSSEH